MQTKDATAEDRPPRDTEGSLDKEKQKRKRTKPEAAKKQNPEVQYRVKGTAEDSKNKE